MRLGSLSSMLPLGFVLMTFISHCYGHDLRVGFYDGKCGGQDIEKLIYGIVKKKIAKDPDVVSDLTRLLFHDCFVRGCDGSILLKGNHTEQKAHINKHVAGMDDIDDIKKAVEKVCPGVVSCTDVLVMAARDAGFLAGGKRYDVETGRRDGRVSSSKEAEASLPPPTIPVNKAIQMFAKNGLNEREFVVLLGGHTVGTAHCNSFKNRLYNFNNTQKPDPTINSALLPLLCKTCPLHSQSENETFLDHNPTSHFKMDNDYYKQIVAHNGTLEIDQNLAINPLTRGIVEELANSPDQFLNEFGPAMVKMARIGVLTGDRGEIRKTCASVN
ncbi:peroxidase 60 [Spinacia oleracea]|uniref:Peroxidase n=1 Tax=Spinacia oleracea TaxID=3562 RepID=A0A9R0IJU3_SPIOL|nr:peroxidase 60-like [Spinacia oleracea]